MTSRFAARLLPYGTLLISNIEELGKLRGGDGTESETPWDIHVLRSQSRAQFLLGGGRAGRNGRRRLQCCSSSRRCR